MSKRLGAVNLGSASSKKKSALPSHHDDRPLLQDCKGRRLLPNQLPGKYLGKHIYRQEDKQQA